MAWDGVERRKNGCKPTGDIGEIKLILTEMRTDHKHLIQKVDEHDKTLYGNGSPGIKAIVNSHSQTLSIVTWVGSILGGSLLTAMFAVVNKLFFKQ